MYIFSVDLLSIYPTEVGKWREGDVSQGVTITGVGGRYQRRSSTSSCEDGAGGSEGFSDSIRGQSHGMRDAA